MYYGIAYFYDLALEYQELHDHETSLPKERVIKGF